MLQSNESGAQALNEQKITSLEIAEISGKNHKELLRSIRNQEVAWEKVCGLKFALTSNKVKMPNGGFRTEKMYNLTKMESLYIISKFDDMVRAKLVKRWYELERKKQPNNTAPQLKQYADANGIIDAIDVVLESEAINNTAVRKFSFANTWLYVVTDIAKQYQQNAKNAYRTVNRLNARKNMFIKALLPNGNTQWCADEKGKAVLEGMYNYEKLNRQLKLAL